MRVVIRKNGECHGKVVVCPSTFQQLLQTGRVLLGLEESPSVIFSEVGDVIDSLEVIRDNDVLVLAACNEPFIANSASHGAHVKEGQRLLADIKSSSPEVASELQRVFRPYSTPASSTTTSTKEPHMQFPRRGRGSSTSLRARRGRPSAIAAPEEPILKRLTVLRNFNFGEKATKRADTILVDGMITFLPTDDEDMIKDKILAVVEKSKRIQITRDDFLFVRCEGKKIIPVTSSDPWSGKALRILAGQGAVHVQLKKSITSDDSGVEDVTVSTLTEDEDNDVHATQSAVEEPKVHVSSLPTTAPATSADLESAEDVFERAFDNLYEMGKSDDENQENYLPDIQQPLPLDTLQRVRAPLRFVGDNLTPLHDIIREHAKKHLNEVSDDSPSSAYLSTRISRANIWPTTLEYLKRWKDSDLHKPIKVQFLGESAEDAGGPRREFFALATKEAIRKLMCGSSGRKTFTHNGVALRDQSYFYLGRFFALALLQGGCGPQCFAQSIAEVVLYEIRNNRPDIHVNDVPDRSVQELLEKIEKVSTVDELRAAIEECDFRFDCGFLKPSVSIKMEDKETFLEVSKCHFVLNRCHAEIQQFLTGLNTLGVLGLIRQYPSQFLGTMVQGLYQPTVDNIIDLFDAAFSADGSNRKKDEDQIYLNWVFFLNDVHGEKVISPTLTGRDIKISLGMVMKFATGAPGLPAEGFDCKPQIVFNHQPKSVYPTANTCANTIHLSMRKENQDFETFKKNFTGAIINGPGFGNV